MIEKIQHYILAVITAMMFTLSSFAQTNSPGHVHPSSLKGWFKVENYTGTIKWKNDATYSNLKELTTGNPPKNGELWNYNPTLRFEGVQGNNGFRSSVPNIKDILEEDNGTMIVIASYTGANNSEVKDKGVCGYFSKGNEDEFSIHQHISYFRAHTKVSNVGEAEWISPITNSPSIRTSIFTHSEGQLKNYYNNLPNGNDNFNNPSGFGKLGNPTQKYFGIGEVPQRHFYNGLIAEVVVYAKTLSDSERLRTESYLAIKYGITLGSDKNPVNYTSSDENGSIIWKGSTEYQNNIIGIGRDDISKLSQKQSHQMDDSVRIYLSDLKTNNIQNNGSFSKDRAFIIAGANTGAMNATEASNLELMTTQGNCDLFSRIEREWKIQRTNMIESFNMDVKLNASATNHSVNPIHLRVLFDDDGDFSNGGTKCYYNGDGSGIEITFVNGEIKIAGISELHIPNNQTRHMTIGSVNSATPLPVGLTSFTAECNRNYVDLVWETETETNNSFFTIQKSDDGWDFETINIMTGNGNSSTANTYNISDFNNKSGITYYRLSQTDFDGKETKLETIAVDCDGDYEVSIHPNPTTEGVFITLTNNKENYLNVSVYNMLGEQVKNRCINESTWIELPEQNGIYLIKYRINDEIHIEKIVKY